MITAVDIENTFSNGDNMPYSGENTLVSCGYLTNTGEQDYLCFYHAEQPPTKNNVVVPLLIKYNTLPATNQSGINNRVARIGINKCPTPTRVG